MILACKECDTKFLIEASDIGEKGRRVRCGNCASVWFVKPPEPEKVEQEKEVAKAQKENLQQAVADKAAGIEPSLPSTVMAVQVPKWLKAAMVILVLANAFTFVLFNKKLIGPTSFYDLVGQYRTDGVEIADAKMTTSEDKDKKQYKVQWSVHNTAETSRDLPVRRIKLLDKDLKLIVKNSDKLSKTLEPGQKQALAPNDIPNEDGKVKYIVMEIGNPYELSLR